MRKLHKAYMVFSFLLIGLLGLACFVLGIRSSMERAGFERVAVTTHGYIARIEKIRRWGDTRSVGTPKAYISYEVGGKAYEEPSNYSHTGMEVGQEVMIKYDPSNPTDIRLDSVPVLPIFFFGFGIFVFLLLFIAYKHTRDDRPIKSRKRSNRRDIPAKVERLFLKRTTKQEE